MTDDTQALIPGCFGCKHRMPVLMLNIIEMMPRFCLLKGQAVTQRCDQYEESNRMKALRELTALTEEMGGYDKEDEPCPTK